MEIWNTILGYENYKISNYGNLKNKKTNKILLIDKGYYRVLLYNKGKCKHFSIHRLVAISFIKNPEKKAQVNHINGIKTDNRVENLEWVTSKENINHAWKNGLSKSYKGEMSSKSKITENQALIIINAKRNSNNKRYWGLKELCEKIGISYGIGCEISKGNNWKHLF